MKKFTISFDQHPGSQGEGVRIDFEDGSGVTIYPEAQRDGCKTMIVNVCSKDRCVSSTIMSERSVEVHHISGS